MDIYEFDNQLESAMESEASICYAKAAGIGGKEQIITSGSQAALFSAVISILKEVADREPEGKKEDFVVLACEFALSEMANSG